MEFIDDFPLSYSIKYDLNTLIKNVVSMKMFADSLSLFRVLAKAAITAGKRFIVDVHIVQIAKEGIKWDNLSPINSGRFIDQVKMEQELIKCAQKLQHKSSKWTMDNTEKKEFLTREERKGEPDCTVPRQTYTLEYATYSCSFWFICLRGKSDSHRWNLGIVRRHPWVSCFNYTSTLLT